MVFALTHFCSIDGNAVYVGVHIRRTDMLHDYNIYKGYTVADEAYMDSAVKHMIEALKKQQRPLNIVFVVCSDDMDWTKEKFYNAVFRATYTKNYQQSTVYSVSPIDGQLTSVFGPSGVFRQPTQSAPSTGQLQQATPFMGVNTPFVADDSVRVKIAYSEGRSDGQDLAILSQCNHTIMTVGTYGWWAGYLAGGITIYYKNFPKPGSELSFIFNREEFFPQEWIGL
jgi:hypothetical protein